MDYDRFGGKSPGQFLDLWWNTTTTGWNYPILNGFSLNPGGDAINGTMTLEAGALVDRFGRETGMCSVLALKGKG
jgi:hypothetical protein